MDARRRACLGALWAGDDEQGARGARSGGQRGGLAIRRVEQHPFVAAGKSGRAGRGWDAYKKQNGRGRGFAFARYKNLAAYCALAMEVEVERETGELRVLRVVAAVDSGEAVNPDGIRNQIEGGILQSMSWTTFEEVMDSDARVTSRDG